MVVEFGGTTTVVLAGGGGLLLLMQPHNSPAATISVVRVFIMFSSKSDSSAHCPQRRGRRAGRKGACRHGQTPTAGVIRGLQEAKEAKYRFGIGIYLGAPMLFLSNFG